MNPPYVAPPLTPSLSHISAQFDHQSNATLKPTPRYSAKAALGELSQPQKPQRKAWLSLPVEDRAQPYSYHSPGSDRIAPGLHPVHYSRYASGFGTANSKAFQWSKLLAAGQKDDSASETLQQHSLPLTSTSHAKQPSLLSALSVESLPHYGSSHTFDATVERHNDAITNGSNGATSPHMSIQSSAHSSTTMDLHNDLLRQIEISDRQDGRNQRAPFNSSAVPPSLDRSAGLIMDASRPPTSAGIRLRSRRELPLSEPHDKPNSAPNMHRRPQTGMNGAGIYHGPVCRESSGFANPGVAAAEERWRKSHSLESAALRVEHFSRPISASFEPDLPDTQPAVPLPEANPSNDRISSELPSRRNLNLSLPHNTPNSSPRLHERPKRGHNAAGVYNERVCVEHSGFANPTAEISRLRWGPADAKEGRGRWNGMPSVNSWDMTKTHVFHSTNCFDPIGNGFGMSGRVKTVNFEGARDGKGRVNDEGTAISRSIGFEKHADEGGSAHQPAGYAELDQAGSMSTDVSGPLSPAKYPATSSRSGFWEGLDSDLMGIVPFQPTGGITPYPVPPGLIAASIKAGKERRLKKRLSGHKNERREGASGDESNSSVPPFQHDNAGAISNDGSPAFFRDLDYRQQKNYRGSVWPQRSSAPHNSGFGEGSGVPTGERTERKDRGLAAERLRNRKVDMSQTGYVDVEEERRIKGTHLPLRITRGNALGLRFSQARNCGFGEGNGALPRDRFEQRGNWQDEIGEEESDEEEVVPEEEREFRDREERKRLQDWRECDRLRWTKNSGFGIGDRGARDVKGRPKHSAEYEMRLGYEIERRGEEMRSGPAHAMSSEYDDGHPVGDVSASRTGDADSSHQRKRAVRFQSDDEEVDGDVSGGEENREAEDREIRDYARERQERRDRHEKRRGESKSPLRAGRGNALGLHSSQPPNTGFGKWRGEFREISMSVGCLQPAQRDGEEPEVSI